MPHTCIGLLCGYDASWDMDRLGTAMKSVVELVSIARSFPGAIQEALHMVNKRSRGLR